MSGIGTSAFDEERLQSEMERYHNQLDSETERLYTLASEAREKGLDFSTEVEIPTAWAESPMKARVSIDFNVFLESVFILDAWKM